MFYSFNRLIEDWNIGISGGNNDLHLSIDNKGKRQKALFRVAVKLAATVVIIGAGAVVVANPDVSDNAIRSSYLAFGFVLGYWCR